MIKLIPMAGAGSRFAEAGYQLPKPLIELEGEPMVVHAARMLPEASTNIFICRDFQLKDYQVDRTIRNYYPEAKFISVAELTAGQASTCLLAKEYINNNEELIIGASDNGIIYDQAKFQQLKADADVIVFGFRNNVTVKYKPEQYGWIQANEQGQVLNISVKKAISSNPVQDQAIVGTFWFKRGADFVQAAETMIKANRRINNEFYVDECINDAIAMGLKVRCFEVDYYICWGTPNDLKTYEYWRSFFHA